MCRGNTWVGISTYVASELVVLTCVCVLGGVCVCTWHACFVKESCCYAYTH